MLTNEETKLIHQGFRHCVDKGYGKLETAADVIKVLEVALEDSRRWLTIHTARREETAQNVTMIMFLEPAIKSLKMRTGAL